MSRAIDRTLGGQLEKIIDAAVEEFRSLLNDFAVSTAVESEIEGALAAAFFVSERIEYSGMRRHRYNTSSWIGPEHITFEDIADWKISTNEITVIPQVIVGAFRVDFMTVMPMFDIAHDKFACQHLAIECDGHEFHEKTKLQAARDKGRDRELLIRGIPSMRFTGSEIWRDPFACIQQIDDFYTKAFMRFLDVNKGIPGE